MGKHLTVVCWKGEKFWLGKPIEYLETMPLGETLEELEADVRDA